MSEIHADGGALPHIPDHLTISQFITDVYHPVRPLLTRPQPWLIEEATGREIGSDEIGTRVYGLANALKIRYNLEENEVVCIFSPNHVEYIVAVWAVHRLGGIITTSNPMYTPEELVYQLQMTKTRLILVHPGMLAVAQAAARTVGLPQDRIVLIDPMPKSPHASLQDLITIGIKEKQQFTERRFKAGEARTKLAFLLFSSGTTGRPKAVKISHYNIIANLVQIGRHTELHQEHIPQEQHYYRSGDIVMGILPFFHAYGLIMVLFGSIFLAQTIVVSPRFQFERLLQSVQQYRITHLYLVPPMAVLIAKSPLVQKFDLSSLRVFACGAAPLSAELTSMLSRVLPPKTLIAQGYGMTETATMITFPFLEHGANTPGATGVLVPGMTARIVKQDGKLAAQGEPGELQLKGPAIALGYFENPTATAETFQDGWLRTGDEVLLTPRKEIVVVDRIKELIKVRGFQVAPSELEGHLLDHPAVADVCVVGVPDDYSGELPLAFVLLRPDAQARVKASPEGAKQTKAAIVKHVSDHKTRFKWLAGVEFVDAIPKNPSGKLLRRVLREQAKRMLASGQLTLVAQAKL